MRQGQCELIRTTVDLCHVHPGGAAGDVAVNAHYVLTQCGIIFPFYIHIHISGAQQRKTTLG